MLKIIRVKIGKELDWEDRLTSYTSFVLKREVYFEVQVSDIGLKAVSMIISLSPHMAL